MCKQVNLLPIIKKKKKKYLLQFPQPKQSYEFKQKNKIKHFIVELETFSPCDWFLDGEHNIRFNYGVH